MSVTLERLDERTRNHADDLSDLKAEIAAIKLENKAVWRIIYWGGGAAVGFGTMFGLLLPRIQALLGL